MAEKEIIIEIDAKVKSQLISHSRKYYNFITL